MSTATSDQSPEDVVDAMGRAERVTWLQRRGVSDLEICNALLDPEDHDLRAFTIARLSDPEKIGRLDGR